MSETEDRIKVLGVGIQAAPYGLTKVRNNTDVPQSVVHNGAQITLGAFAEEKFAEDIAAKFLARCYPVVTKVDETAANSLNPKGGATVWVANLRGSPRFPKKTKVWQRNHQARRLEQVEVDNPKCARGPITREYDQGQEEFTDRGGQKAMRNLPKETITIPPRSRVEMSADRAQWFLRRDSLQVEEMKGCAIRSRAPSNFEPDMRWPLDESRAYLRFVDPDASLGPDEEQLKKRTKGKTEGEALAILRKAKADVLDQLFDYLADPRYRLPTKEEFQEFLTGKPAIEVEKEELARLLGQVEENLANAEG